MKMIEIVETTETGGFRIFKTIKRVWRMLVDGKLMKEIIYRED